MFRPRRAALLKRLCRALWRGASEPATERQRAAARAVFKRLDETQLDALLRLKESDGADCASCVLLPRLGDGDDVAPLLVLCRLLRWPDLETGKDLKRLDAICCPEETAAMLCCNPYHWSRICTADTPALPCGRLIPSLDHTDVDADWSSYCQSESLETGGTHQTCSTDAEGNVLPKPWCTLAYWELSQRVGRLLPNREECLAVFDSTVATAQDGICLAALTAQHPARNESVQRTRGKVGLGLILWRESSGIWMYNRSSSPMFVNSPTLDPPGPGPLGAPRTQLVYRVNPGYSTRVFDYDRARWYRQLASGSRRVPPEDSKPLKLVEEAEGPFNPYSVRVSFAKGWGPKYSRQCITTCPCWLEVLLDPCR